jgi:hypothetical protein
MDTPQNVVEHRTVGCTTEEWQLRGWHGQTRLTVVVPVVREDTLKLRWGVPPRVPNLLCHNLVVHPNRVGRVFAIDTLRGTAYARCYASARN